jgi:peroxiredoxin
MIRNEKDNTFIIVLITSVIAFGVNIVFTLSNSWLLGIMLVLGIAASVYLEKHNSSTYTPTVWTSLGLLFTFISLLLAFVGDIEMDSNQGVNLVKILPLISSAFTTSIIGIFISMIINIRNKVAESVIEQQTDSPENNLLNMKNNISSLVDIMKDSVNHNQELLQNIDSSFNSLSENIAGSVNSGVIKVMSEMTAKIMKEFETLSKGLNDNVASHTKTLGETMNTQLGEFVSAIESFSNSNIEFMTDQTKGNKEVTDSFKNEISDIKTMLSSMFKENVDELNRAITQIIGMSKDNIEENKVLISQFAKLIHEFSDSKANQIELLNLIKEVTNQNRQLQGQDAEHIHTISELSQQIIESNTQVNLKLDEVIEITKDNAA